MKKAEAVFKRSFLSTPSARRATSNTTRRRPPTSYFYPRPPRGGRRHRRRAGRQRPEDFYPRPPRGGRRQLHRGREGRQRISIHALREEGDSPSSSPMLATFQFLSTPSARRATPHGAERLYLLGDFYPRPPRGGRPTKLPATYTEYIFLSTPSARRATHRPDGSPRLVHISIHALREEGDAQTVDGVRYDTRISIHALREEGDSTSFRISPKTTSFLSTPSARRATHLFSSPG